MTDLEVCNRALSLLGEGSIAALTTEEAGNDSRVSHCLTQLPAAKAEFLALIDWGFARDDAVLVETDAPTIGWAHAHTLPADNNRLVKVYGAAIADAEPDGWERTKNFALGNGKIRSNFEFVAVEYIADADFSIWPPGALAAVVRLLAHYLAVPITGKPDLAALMLRVYEQRERPDAQFQDVTQFASNENYDPGALPSQAALIGERTRGLNSYEDDLL